MRECLIWTGLKLKVLETLMHEIVMVSMILKMTEWSERAALPERPHHWSFLQALSQILLQSDMQLDA